MGQYQFRGKDHTLAVVEGTVEADSQVSAVVQLGRAGISPFLLRECPVGGRSGGLFRRRVSTQAIAHMSRQLADLLGGGVPVDRALALVAAQVEQQTLGAVLQQVQEAVRGGHLLSEALVTYPRWFSPVYLGMIRAGESSGQLEAALARLADMLENESDMAHRLAAALAYPLLVLSLGLVAVVMLLVVVIPNLRMLFDEMGRSLPLPTRMVLAISQGVSQWWAVGALGIAGMGWGVRAWTRSAQGRAWIDQALLRLPLIGAVICKHELARWMRHLGLLIGQGLAVLPALGIAGRLLSNTHLRQAMERAARDVQAGLGLAAALAASRRVPVFVCNMVSVGEESGALERSLLTAASAYERDTAHLLRVLMTLLEPSLIIVVGLIVMGIVLSLLLPIFELGVVTQ